MSGLPSSLLPVPESREDVLSAFLPETLLFSPHRISPSEICPSEVRISLPFPPVPDLLSVSESDDLPSVRIPGPFCFPPSILSLSLELPSCKLSRFKALYRGCGAFASSFLEISFSCSFSRSLS